MIAPIDPVCVVCGLPATRWRRSVGLVASLEPVCSLHGGCKSYAPRSKKKPRCIACDRPAVRQGDVGNGKIGWLCGNCPDYGEIIARRDQISSSWDEATQDSRRVDRRWRIAFDDVHQIGTID